MVGNEEGWSSGPMGRIVACEELGSRVSLSSGSFLLFWIFASYREVSSECRLLPMGHILLVPGLGLAELIFALVGTGHDVPCVIQLPSLKPLKRRAELSY
jgi:hypothetical protein